MKTPPVLNMPRSLDIMRARCAEGEYRDYPTVDWTNFMSSYMNDFCNTLSFYFPRIYYDMRYGYILFGNYGGTYTLSSEAVTGIPGYWWWLPWFTFPSYPSEDVLPHGELAYSGSGFRINIDGTTYDKLFAEVDVSDDVYADEAISISAVSNVYTISGTPYGARWWEHEAAYEPYHQPAAYWTNNARSDIIFEYPAAKMQSSSGISDTGKAWSWYNQLYITWDMPSSGDWKITNLVMKVKQPWTGGNLYDELLFYGDAFDPPDIDVEDGWDADDFETLLGYWRLAEPTSWDAGDLLYTLTLDDLTGEPSSGCGVGTGYVWVTIATDVDFTGSKYTLRIIGDDPYQVGVQDSRVAYVCITGPQYMTVEAR